MRLPGIGSHHSARVITDEWMTPHHITRALGPFDLDPCAPHGGWVRNAARYLTIEEDGLTTPWEGRVWLNPPYSEVEAWVARLAEHGTGTALLFARTETRWWFDHIWPRASALLFLRGRISFERADGSEYKAGHNSGGPSVLIAYGEHDAAALGRSGLTGYFVRLVGAASPNQETQ